MRAAAAIGAVGARAACAHAGSAPAAGPCRADALGDVIGQPFSNAARATAEKRSGARTVRVIRPGDAVTMEYREDRLNLMLDPAGRVASARCG